MTHERDLERLLDTWFADGPQVVADRVIDDTAARIARQRQRPAWRLQPWRFPVMSTSLKLAFIGAALLAALGAGSFLFGGAGRGPAPGPSAPTPTPAPTAPPSPSYPVGYPIGGLLTPGTYTTRSFRPGVTFTVPEGWIKTEDVAPTSEVLGVLGLIQDTPVNRAQWALSGESDGGILLVAGLTSPYYVCEAWEENQGATAAEMVAKVTANPKLRTSVVEDVAIGGLTGKQFDVRFNPDFRGTTCPGDPPGKDLTQDRNRAILLDLPRGGVLVMFIGTRHPDTFEAQVEAAMPIVDSFKFDLGQ